MATKYYWSKAPEGAMWAATDSHEVMAFRIDAGSNPTQKRWRNLKLNT